MRLAILPVVALVASAVLATEHPPRTLTFDDRVVAQEAIERVFYAHQLGATRPFSDAVPRAVLEAKVRKVLEQSAALNRYWKTAVTDDMLERELERMARSTRMPDRLSELFSALGNDPFIIKECLARATLADRLSRNFYAFDPALHADARGRAEHLRSRLQAGRLNPFADYPNRSVTELARRAELPARVRQVSDVEETRDAFSLRVILSETKTSLRVARYVVPKPSWDAWWETAHLAVKSDPVVAVASDRGPSVPPAAESSAGGHAPACADDTWDNGELFGVPDARSGHTAVWTGSLMVIWGGYGAGGYFDSGGLYDPATDSWTPTSTRSAPSARARHTALWTGTEMVVWGGVDYNALNTGGRYNPTTDSWTPTSTAGAPSGRYGNVAVWTGKLVVVWGGAGEVTGGRYDPATDRWAPTSTNAAPPESDYRNAVWTGSLMVVLDVTDYGYAGGRYDPETDRWKPISTTEAPDGCGNPTLTWVGSVMVVWCTYDHGEYHNTGGRYDPDTDSWKPMSTAGVYTVRNGYSTVWTGSEMVIWGGHNYRGLPLSGGARYDPITDSWADSLAGDSPSARDGHTAVWTGSRMLVWGGHDFSHDLNTGGRYDPKNDRWTPTSTGPMGGPAARYGHTAVWTGSHMVVWGGHGGDDAGYLDTGGRYDPATDSWMPTSTVNAPSGRDRHTAVWTGDRMVIWGGNDGDYPDRPLDTGGRYDPVADRWTPTSALGAPSARFAHTAVWTGNRMVIWGGDEGTYGGRSLDTGARYDPAIDRWTPTATMGAPSPRSDHSAVWTGTTMVVWGGGDNTGGRYDPATDNWTPTSTTGAPWLGHGHIAVWTGRRMLTWNAGNGGRYDPTTDDWTPMSTTSGPSTGHGHTALWTGSRMVVWGGNIYDDTGFRYDPLTDSWTPTTTTGAPSARSYHTAVWTGSLMVVWGGSIDGTAVATGGRYLLGLSVDDDGDGISECDGDCDDANPTVHPGAADRCDGLDDDCDGAVDNGPDAVCDDGSACTVGDSCRGGVCVGGVPVVCSASDPCHIAGVCNPATGVCSNPVQADGTVCDDASLCTAGETCQSGRCTAAISGLDHPKPKSSGYYKTLCERRKHSHLPYQGDQLTTADARCVGQLTQTFSGISTIDDICNVIDDGRHGGRHQGGPGDGPDGKDCDKGENELIATALNVCRARVCEEQSLDSRCHGNAVTSVNQSLADADATLDDAARDKDTCKAATCELREINNGHALEMNSLVVAKESSKVRLSWSSPTLDDGSGAPGSYEIWRRPLGSSDAFVKLGTTTGLTYLDATAGGAAWEYDLTAVMPGD